MATSVEKLIESLKANGEPQVRWVDINLVKENPDNPRKISDADMDALKESIKSFPKMLVYRPGVVDENMILLGGNQRRRACRELGWPEFPVMDAKDFSPEQLKEFIIKDNLPFGTWDNKELKKNWDITNLKSWGMDITDLQDNVKLPGEVQFSTELDFESNYVVLTFNKDIDWLQVQTILGLERVYSKRHNGKAWANGVGRVVDGITAIGKIKNTDINL